MGISICEHSWCLFLNSSIFITISLIWNKIIQVWGVTKSVMMTIAWSRYWENSLEIKGQVGCCHSHITNMNFQKPHGKEIGFVIAGATQIGKHSHHSESYLTNSQREFWIAAINEHLIINFSWKKKRKNFKYIFEKMTICLRTMWAGWFCWIKYKVWIIVVQLLSGSLLGFKASWTTDNLGGIQVWFYNIWFNRLNWITLTSNYVFHQTSGSFIDVYIFLQVKEKERVISQY